MVNMVNRRQVLLCLLYLASVNAVWPFKSQTDIAAPPQESSPPTVFASEDPFGDIPAVPSEATSPSPSLDSQKATAPPASPSPSPVYLGRSYKWGNFTFRPAQFVNEAIFLLAILFSTYLGFVGKQKNAAIVEDLVKDITPALREEFVSVGTDNKNKGQVTKQSNSEYSYWATGRRNTTGMSIGIHLKPRSDLPINFYKLVRSSVDFGYEPRGDRLELILTFTPTDEFVFALINKHYLDSIRSERWDVSAFTTFSEPRDLPSTCAVYSESGIVTNTLLAHNSETSITHFFNSYPEAIPYFESLIISDVTVKERPEDKDVDKQLANKKGTINLQIRLPPKGQTTAINPFIALVCNLVDVLSSPKAARLPEDIKLKIKDRRNKIAAEMQAESRKEAKAEAAEALRKKKKADEDARRANLSAEQQKKLEQKERKDKTKKAGQKMVRRA